MSPPTPRTRWLVLALALCVTGVDLWTKQLVVDHLASPSHPIAVTGTAPTVAARLAERGLSRDAVDAAVAARLVWRYRPAPAFAVDRPIDDEIAHLQLLALAGTRLPAPRRLRIDPAAGAFDLGHAVMTSFGVDRATAARMLDGELWRPEAPVRTADEPVAADETLVLLLHEAELVPGFMKLVYAENPGAAWSFLHNANPTFRLIFFSLVSTIAALAMLWAIWTGWMGSPLATWALGAVLGGALGNLVDRLRFRVVIDFVLNYVGDLRWPVYNVADIGITVGVALIVVELIRNRPATGETAD